MNKLNGLSQANTANIQNIRQNAQQQNAVTQPSAAFHAKEAGENKLKKAVTALSIAGITLAAGVGVYYLTNGKAKKPSAVDFKKGFTFKKGSTKEFSGKIKHKTKDGDKITLVYKNGVLQNSKRRGRISFDKTFSTLNGEKLVKTTSEGLTTEVNITKLHDNALKTKVYSVKKTKNGKIHVRFQKGKNISRPVELPEYLYHITSKASMEKIKQSGVLKISQNEQLTGLYLLDSENFLNSYGNTKVGNQNKDLLSAIFRQANKGNKGLPASEQKLMVIKIPTDDLLKGGKLRMRCQEDFFNFTEQIKVVNQKTGKKYDVRKLCNDAVRAEFRDIVLSKNIMNEAQIDSFMDEMTSKIHKGYNLGYSENLGKNHSVEYIFNHNINLADYPNIKVQTIEPFKYLSNNGKTFDRDKVKTIFDGNFETLKQDA